MIVLGPMRGILLVAAVLSGCSASTSPGPTVDAAADTVVADTAAPAPDTARNDTSAEDAWVPDAIPGTCNALVNDAPMIVGENIASLPPAPTGGTILDGVYERTRVISYTGAGGASGPATETDRAVVSLMGGVFQSVSDSNGSGDRRHVGTYTTTGTTLRLRETCPSTGISPFDGYSVSGDTLTFSSSTLRRALVLKRR